MAYEVPVITSALNNIIEISHPQVPVMPDTNLASSAVAGALSITVLDNGGFANNDYLIIGDLGNDKTEIVKINGAVTAGTALTVTALTYDHPVDTPIRKTLWNQISLQGAATYNGSSSAVAVISITPDQGHTTYVNVGTTYNFYFAQYYDGTTFSAVSDPAPAAGYAYNSVRAVKDEALSMTGVNVEDSQLITDHFLNQQIQNCEIETWRHRKRWSWTDVFNYILGTVSEGQYSLSLPSNCADPKSKKGVMRARIKDRAALDYVTKEEFDQRYQENRHTAVTVAVNPSDATINVTSTADFDSTGSFLLGADTIAYTGKTATTFTGCTSVTLAHSVGDDVWQNIVYQEPTSYSVWGGKLYLDHPMVADFAGSNLYLDYQAVPTFPNSDYDTLTIPDPSLYHYYIAWKILLRKNNGKATPESDAMKTQYEVLRKKLALQERGQRATLRPRINTIRYPDNDEFVTTTPATIP